MVVGVSIDSLLILTPHYLASLHSHKGFPSLKRLSGHNYVAYITQLAWRVAPIDEIMRKQLTHIVSFAMFKRRILFPPPSLDMDILLLFSFPQKSKFFQRKEKF